METLRYWWRTLFWEASRLSLPSSGAAADLACRLSTAEGYFTLVLCTYRFLISWQNHNFASHDSWLEPRFPPGTPWFKRLISSFTIIGPSRRPMSVMHNLLIAANAIIISGE